jgi:hypothetical protein
MDWITILQNTPTLGSKIWAKDSNGIAQLGYADINNNKLCLKDINGSTILDAFIHWSMHLPTEAT